MRFVIKWILSALVIYLLSRYLEFIRISDLSALLVFMLVIALLNVSLKPVLIILTIPVTIVTFGLFLIVINGLMVILADYFIKGIYIGNGLLGAIIFSLFISLSHYLIDMIIGDN
jgi:putative membrane protein